MAGIKNLHTIDALNTITVRTDIVLRPLEQGDSKRLLEILDADPSIRENVSIAKRIRNERDIEAEIKLMNGDGDIIRYSILKNEFYIGLISFWRLGDLLAGWNDTSIPEETTYGFGYFLDPAERGNGVMVDSVKAIMAVACKTLGPKKFIAFCTDENESSAHVLKKCGFTASDKTVFFPSEGWTERLYILSV